MRGVNTMKYIELEFTLTGERLRLPAGDNLLQIAEKYSHLYKTPVVAAKVGNVIVELLRPLDKGGQLSFLDLTCVDGIRIYQRGLLFLLHKAVKRLSPKAQLHVLHSVGSGIYCEIRQNGQLFSLTDENLSQIEEDMRRTVQMNLTFEKHEFYKEDAFNILRNQGDWERIRLFKFRKKKTVKLYKCGDYWDYFYGYMPPSTGCLRVFKLVRQGEGFLILHPSQRDPHSIGSWKNLPKLSSVFLEYARWLEIMNIDTVADLNEIIAKSERNVVELMNLTEALHEKKISQIAEQFHKSKARVILIAGPSSSGKTTFAKRLLIQLRVLGLRPVIISLDDYFVDRERTPKDKDGNYDFDSLGAIDIELFNHNLMDLLKGKCVEIPSFDFKLGKRKWTGHRLCLAKDQPIIIEGIHGLNEALTPQIPRKSKFKIYVSALTQLNLDYHNRISTTDTRLVRRIVRDYKFRGHSALDTLRMWPKVRRGEELYIFPFQEEADAMFNSALPYELSVLKVFAESLLIQVQDDSNEYPEALRLLKMLEYFLPITNIEDIPRTSILREFIGRSVFKY